METTSDSGALGGNVLPVGVQPLEPGDPASVGGHRLTGRLSRSEATIVYLGRDSRGALVAIKTTRASDTSQVARRLRAQASAARRLPSFCTAGLIVDGSDQSPPFLISEYVEGPSLEEFVTEMGPLEPSRLTALASALAEALAAIHAVGVVHRDLRPSDVMLAADGPRVIGFAVSDAPAGTALESLHTAPRPDGDPRSDVFAWGRVIGFAATGRNPVTHPSALDTVSEPVRGLVTAALSDDPSARPAAQDLLEGLGVTKAIAAEVSSEDSTEVFSRIPAEPSARPEALARPERPALSAPSVWDPAPDRAPAGSDVFAAADEAPGRTGAEAAEVEEAPEATGHHTAPDAFSTQDMTEWSHQAAQRRPGIEPPAHGTRATDAADPYATQAYDTIDDDDLYAAPAPRSANASGPHPAQAPRHGADPYATPARRNAEASDPYGTWAAPGQDDAVRHPGPPVGRPTAEQVLASRSPATNPRMAAAYDQPAEHGVAPYPAAGAVASYCSESYAAPPGRGTKPPAGKAGRGQDPYENAGRRWFKALAVISIPVTLAAVFAAFIVTTSTDRYTGGQSPLDPAHVPPTSDQNIAHSSGPSIQGRRSTGPRRHRTATPGVSDTPITPTSGLPGQGHTLPGRPGHSHTPTSPPPTHTKPPTHPPTTPSPSPTPTGTKTPPEGTGHAMPPQA